MRQKSNARNSSDVLGLFVLQRIAWILRIYLKQRIKANYTNDYLTTDFTDDTAKLELFIKFCTYKIKLKQVLFGFALTYSYL